MCRERFRHSTPPPTSAEIRTCSTTAIGRPRSQAVQARRSLARSGGHRYGVHVDLGDASVPWLSLTPDATTAALALASRRPTCSCRRTLRSARGEHGGALQSVLVVGRPDHAEHARRRGAIAADGRPCRRAAALGLSPQISPPEPCRCSPIWSLAGSTTGGRTVHVGARPPRRNVTVPSEDASAAAAAACCARARAMRRMRETRPAIRWPGEAPTGGGVLGE